MKSKKVSNFVRKLYGLIILLKFGLMCSMFCYVWWLPLRAALR